MSDAPRKAFQLPDSADRIDQNLDEELRFHIEERRDQLIAEGLTPEQAELEVRRRFGDYDAYRRETRRIDEVTIREQHRADFLATLWRETRHSARVLLRQRSFSAIAFITLALGLGATTAMYSVLDEVVLSPLAYPAADRLVSVLHPSTVPGSGERRWGVSPGGYFHFRDQARTIAAFGIYRNFSMAVTNDDLAELARFAVVTHGLFDAFQARPRLGRLIGADDDRPGAPLVAVLSHEFHQSRFGGRANIIGTTLQTAGSSYEIVGVTEPGLSLPMPGPFSDATNLNGFGVDVWIAMRLDPAGPFYNNHPNVGIARLADGATAATATAELSNLLARFPQQMPQAYSEEFIRNYNFRVEASALRESVLGKSVPRLLWMLFASVLIVLGIAAANVGNLFLVRIEAHRREAALREALGADRAHMMAHYLSESLLLCLAAGVAGLGLAALALRVVVRIAPTDIPRLAGVSLGGAAVTFGLVTALLLGLLLGVVPLFRKGLDLDSLRDGGRGLSASPRQRLARSTLVAGQLALTVILLTAAGLMLRSFDQLRQVRPGFDASHALVFDVSLPFSEYDDREKAAVAHRDIQAALRALPGVVSVGAGPLPLRDFGTGCSVVFRENAPYASGEQTPCVSTPIALPGYFDALGIEVAGHVPDWSDVANRTQAAVVTRALAERLWPGEDPIGKGINSFGPNADSSFRVTGVVDLLHAESLEQPPTEGVFYPATDFSRGRRDGSLNDLTIIVRTSGADPLSLAGAARAAVRSVSARAPVSEMRSMRDVVGRSMARTSFLVALLGAAALVALVLSAVGTYGVISYIVTQRRVEIGIRMALGATVPEVVRLVVLQTARIALVGLVIGLVASLAGTRTMQSLLYGVSASDPVVLLGASVLLAAVVTTASFAPARRAARIQPVEAMRGG